MMKVFTILPWLLLSGGIHAFVPCGTSSTGIVAKSRNTELRMMNGANLMNYALEKVIDTSVPTLGAIAVVLVAAKAFQSNKNKFPTENVNVDLEDLLSDLYGDDGDDDGASNPLANLFKKGYDSGVKKTLNKGYPKNEFLRITSLNEIYNSYKFSIEKATAGKYKAVNNFKIMQFQKAFRKSTDILKLSDRCISSLLDLEENFLKDVVPLAKDLEMLTAKLRKLELDNLEVVNATSTGESQEKSGITGIFNSLESKFKKKESKILKAMSEVTLKVKKLETSFYTAALTTILEDLEDEGEAEKALALYKKVFGEYTSGSMNSSIYLSDPSHRPLNFLFQSKDLGISDKKVLYVLNFNGDVTASQVDFLREEITAILLNNADSDSNVKPHVLLTLQTGGGTVTGYGLAASQLMRLKSAGIPLSICVEQVAASGGYMMACLADTGNLIASPFSVLGSIGVISEQPNVYERLKREGIRFNTVTAGKYKRTLTPFKEYDKADLEKSKEDLEAVYRLFKSFVSENRQVLRERIDMVATGETWFGEDALQLNLCDRLATVDEIIGEYVMDGYDAYLLEYVGEENGLSSGIGKLLPGSSIAKNTFNIKGMLKETIRDLLYEEMSIGKNKGVANTVRFEDKGGSDYFFM